MPGIKKTFIITSVTCFPKKKLPDSVTRSVFTPEERVKQTCKTINSIREKIPGALIILLEMGREKDISEELTRMADKYVFIGNNRLVNWAVGGRNRGLGEAMGLIVAKKELQTGSDFFFKISGRYFLNEQFEPAKWQGDLFIARKYGTAISTRLYGFGKELFADWQKALKMSLWKLYRGRSIEDILPLKIGEENIYDIKKIGVAGYVAPDGSYLEE